jgi:TatD DNase family protein
MWIDSHAHLEMKEFDPDRPQVIQRAFNQAVTRIITIGTNIESSRQAVALAKTYQIIWATVGFHPHDAASFHPEILPQLTQLTNDKHVVAVGEIGLDFIATFLRKSSKKKPFEI